MDRDIAIRMDGMLLGVLGSLDRVARYMKGNLSKKEYSKLIKSIGESMGAVVELSNSLHAAHPDIVPKELRPPGKRRGRR